VHAEQAGVTTLERERLNGYQWWKILVFPMQKAYPFRNKSRWKISAAKIPDLDRSRESILKRRGHSLPRERPLHERSYREHTEDDHQGSTSDQAPAWDG